MAITIKNKHGVIKKIGSTDTAEAFCTELAKLEAHDLAATKTDVWIAYHLGYGSLDARERLSQDGTFTADWTRHLHNFTNPRMGSHLLPQDAEWRLQSGAQGAEAEITISGQSFSAEARTPWAAFAICLIRASLAGRLPLPGKEAA